MEKIIKQWFEECTEPWAAKALEHTIIEKGENLLANSLSKALELAFPWRFTEEGYTYWNNIHFDLWEKENNEKDV